MKLENALKKLEKLGAQVTFNGYQYNADLGVSFIENLGRITAIQVGGVFCDNLTQAIALAQGGAR